MTSFIHYSFKKFSTHKRKIKRLLLLVLIFLMSLFALSFVFGTSNKISLTTYYEPKEILHSETPLENTFLFFNGTFHDNRELYKEIIETISSAEHSLLLASYSITHPEIIALLEKKRKEGVFVEVLVPISKDPRHRLAFALTNIEPIEVGSHFTFSNDLHPENSDDALMHHKFLIADIGTKNESLHFGSINFTEFQINHDAGFILSTEDRNIIRVFKDEYDSLKRGDSGTKKLTTENYQPFNLLANYPNGVFEIWFGPGYKKNSLKSRILDDINSAQESIKIIGWRIGDRDIINALYRQADKGIRIQIILDDFYLWEEGSLFTDILGSHENIEIVSDSYSYVYLYIHDLLQEKGLPEDFNPYLHHHTLIIDEQYLLAGTNNWSQRGFYVNDESIVITDIDSLVDTYLKEFDFIYNYLEGSFSKEKINKKIDRENLSQIPYNETKRYIYFIEKSYPFSSGIICFDTSRGYELSVLSFPKECDSSFPIKLFIIDEQNSLEEAHYIF